MRTKKCVICGNDYDAGERETWDGWTPEHEMFCPECRKKDESEHLSILFKRLQGCIDRTRHRVVELQLENKELKELLERLKTELGQKGIWVIDCKAGER